jgi:hypothetical protein
MEFVTEAQKQQNSKNIKLKKVFRLKVMRIKYKTSIRKFWFFVHKTNTFTFMRGKKSGVEQNFSKRSLRIQHFQIRNLLILWLTWIHSQVSIFDLIWIFWSLRNFSVKKSNTKFVVPKLSCAICYVNSVQIAQVNSVTTNFQSLALFKLFWILSVGILMFSCASYLKFNRNLCNNEEIFQANIKVLLFFTLTKFNLVDLFNTSSDLGVSLINWRVKLVMSKNRMVF